MELVLQRFDSNQELSVGECLMKAVEGMDEEGRLEMALEVVEMGLEQEERLQEVVTETWRLILQGEWWRARYGSLTEFMRKCGMSESVKELVNGRMRTEKLKRKFERLASERLGGGELKERLGEELMPTRLSKGFLEAMNALAKQVEDAEDAKELLVKARDRRLGVRGKRWTTRTKIFCLLFFPNEVDLDVQLASAQGWQKLPYLHGVNSLRVISESHGRPDLLKRLRGALYSLFATYCLCIPSPSRDRWITAWDKEKTKPGWIGFSEERRLESPDHDRSIDNSWRLERRIDEDWCWDLPAERAVLDDTMREARSRFRKGPMYARSVIGSFAGERVELILLE